MSVRPWTVPAYRAVSKQNAPSSEEISSRGDSAACPNVDEATVPDATEYSGRDEAEPNGPAPLPVRRPRPKAEHSAFPIAPGPLGPIS
jgi:hypothetical protein